MGKQGNSGRVRTVETTIEIIDEIVALERVTMNELADRLDLAPSTVHRHLSTLEAHNYVSKEDGMYRIGFQFLTIGGIARNLKTEYKLAEKYVEMIAQETGERAQFVVEENGERIFLFRRVGENAVLGDANIGKRGPLHCSAAGKAIMAELPEERVEMIIRRHGLPSLTENTITDPDALYAELETIRTEGYAINREESAEGFHAVGVSITGSQGGVIGSLSVSGPAHRLKPVVLEDEMPDLLMGLGQELELKVKYS